jgi:PAS domain S-box-containing protein
MSRTTPRSLQSRILIVDDNVALVDSLRTVLLSSDNSFHVVTAARAAEALAIAAEVGFDVAIVDVKLPDGSGLELIEPLRATSFGSEVVLVTGAATLDSALVALKSGAYAYVLKSFQPEELLSTLAQARVKVQLTREKAELERRYRDLVELTDVLVVGLDTQLRVVLFNRKAADVAGVERDVAVGMNFLESWIPTSFRARLREACHLTETLRTPQECETEFVAPGTHRRIRWQLSWASGLVYGIGIDVTERLALERRAADSEAISAMGGLAMNLAHEIRNPLNAAVLQLHLMRRQFERMAIDTEVKAKLQQRASVVEDEIGRLSRMLTEFLELARPRGIARGVVHLGELVEQVAVLQRDIANARRVRLRTEVAADGCVALGDAEKLKQVLLNLVVNALEAMKDGGTLVLAVAPAPGCVEVRVADTGPGIEPAILNSVFDPFFTTKEAGTGLGLSIVRKIIEQHGGSIAIESPPLGGTTVLLSVPSSRSQNIEPRSGTLPVC